MPDAAQEHRRRAEGEAITITMNESYHSCMAFHGRVKGGVVLFEAEAPPEGSEVRVEVVTSESPRLTVWDKLRKFAGTVKGLPPDMARNHDHYIHGAPKR